MSRIMENTSNSSLELLADVLKGVLTLEQREAKKTFSALKKGVRKAEAQNLIPRGAEEILRKTISRLVKEAEETKMKRKFEEQSKIYGKNTQKVTAFYRLEEGEDWEQVSLNDILSRGRDAYYLMAKDAVIEKSWFFFPDLLPGKDYFEQRTVEFENPDGSVVAVRMAWIVFGQSIVIIPEERFQAVKKMQEIEVLEADVFDSESTLWIVLREDDPRYKEICQKVFRMNATVPRDVENPENYFCACYGEHTAYGFKGPMHT